jgi:hypothetical protein
VHSSELVERGYMLALDRHGGPVSGMQCPPEDALHGNAPSTPSEDARSDGRPSHGCLLRKHACWLLLLLLLLLLMMMMMEVQCGAARREGERGRKRAS